MAAPTPTTWTEWNGSRGLAYWRAEWTDGTQLTDSVVIDVSALAPAPTSVKVRAIKATLNGDIQATLEYDATTDQLIYDFEGQTDATIVDVVDFTDGPNTGRAPSPGATGFAGDVMLTTLNAASGDELTLLISFQKKT